MAQPETTGQTGLSPADLPPTSVRRPDASASTRSSASKRSGVRDAALDAEVIDLGWRIAESLGLTDLKILLNSIGDIEDRRAYVPSCSRRTSSRISTASPRDDQARWDRAPMRLLDSKDDRTRPFQAGAPVITDHLRPESAAYYDAVKSHLEALGIPYEERPTLGARSRLLQPTRSSRLSPRRPTVRRSRSSLVAVTTV